ncbi:G-type lectin S-receptor-like serine/threonine-protein kinase [Tanacetum coccineum]
MFPSSLLKRCKKKKSSYVVGQSLLTDFIKTDVLLVMFEPLTSCEDGKYLTTGDSFIVVANYVSSCNVFTNKYIADTLSPNEPFKDGDTLVSSNEMFELGFFNIGNSNKRYLGIRYKKISNGTVVWIANRDAPLNNTSGMLQMNSSGILQLISDADTNTTIWSSSFEYLTNVTTVAQLLDNGNFVIRDENRSNEESFIWQSFDYPGNTYLPGMKLGKDFIRGIDRQWVSWKSLDDPSRGEYAAYMDTNGFPQVFLRRGPVLHTRYGPWNGIRFSGMPSLTTNPTAVNQFVVNDKEIYYGFEVNASVLSRLYLNPEGDVTRMNWVNSTQTWFPILTSSPTDSCAQFGQCGPYGTCNTNNFPVCSCMEGFEPKRSEEWDVGDWSSGCVRRTRLDCGNGDGFRRISGVKLPDTRSSWYNLSMSLGECEVACRTNCSCSAYANLDIRNGGSGCLLWFDELLDVREYNETQNLYIRMAVSELPSSVCEGQKEEADIPSFSLSKISKSTNNFSITNKLGEGGFGPVYKGVLDDGQEIAVKRLSKTSRQGLDEFKNEVRCIAKLQHRNLVKLLGYCIQEDETMLIYEYMANKSLDLTIFDESQSSMLDWPQRFHIIHGIARGLLYLHQDSRLRVIHRDLKAANILLDDDMNPKISDFGLARRFKGYETEANTNKVVGTYGYIAPEYAVHGLFSVKSDVFSFGVLVLEIVSGKKNREFSGEEHSDNLLGHAWRLYKEDRSLELVSSQFRDTCFDTDLIRSIHIGLLCVQNHAEDRPTMSSVVVMLDNESTLPPPKQPAFFTEISLPQSNAHSSTLNHNSVADVTITLLDGR